MLFYRFSNGVLVQGPLFLNPSPKSPRLPWTSCFKGLTSMLCWKTIFEQLHNKSSLLTKRLPRQKKSHPSHPAVNSDTVITETRLKEKEKPTTRILPHWQSHMNRSSLLFEIFLASSGLNLLKLILKREIEESIVRIIGITVIQPSAVEPYISWWSD